MLLTSLFQSLEMCMRAKWRYLAANPAPFTYQLNLRIERLRRLQKRFADSVKAREGYGEDTEY